MCSIKNSFVHATVLSSKTIPSSITIITTTNAAASSAGITTTTTSTATVEAAYTLLVLRIGAKDCKVLHADLISPLLTCDMFLVDTKKVSIKYSYTWGTCNGRSFDEIEKMC